MTTSTYSVQLKLVIDPHIEHMLEKRFRIAETIYNRLVHHCIKRLARLRMDPEYVSVQKDIRDLIDQKDKHKKELQRSYKIRKILIEKYELTKFDLIKHVKPIGQRYRKHLDSKVVQCIAKQVYSGVNKILFGDGERLHYKRCGDLSTIRTDTNINRLRYQDGIVYFNDLMIKVRKKQLNDSYTQACMQDRIKYIMIKRLPFNTRYRYYVVLVLEGYPPLKQEIGTGRVGIDIGTSTVACVSDNQVILEELAPKGFLYNDKIKALNEKIESVRRINNPQNYDPDGTIKKLKRGERRVWYNSNNYKKLRMQYKTLNRKRSACVKQEHEILANRILSDGDVVFVEDMNFAGLAKRSKKETEQTDKEIEVKTKSGETKTVKKCKKKKRFGKSINFRSPSLLITIIDRKLVSRGLEGVHKINTSTYKASQYDHTTDSYTKKDLNERWNVIAGKRVQRDLYSAFLIKNPMGDLKTADKHLCICDYDRFVEMHDFLIEWIKQNVTDRPSSFGF